MDDGFSAEKNEASKRIYLFFPKFFFDFSKKWSERRSDNLKKKKN